MFLLINEKNIIFNKVVNLASIFKSYYLPHLIKFGKRLLPALGITTASTLTSHGISKALNKKRGGSILK